MIVGVPKEVKSNEGRVALTPDGARQLILDGHEVLIEVGAGEASGYLNEAYWSAQAKVADSAEAIWSSADLIVKVKEPQAHEIGLVHKDQVVFSFFHLAANQLLTEALVKSGATAIAYEAVQKSDGSLPLLAPMSEVAGRMAVQEAAKHLETAGGGMGRLLGGIPGVLPATVLILGAGVVGLNAAQIAAGMGAKVLIMDVNLQRLRRIDETLPRNVFTMMASEGAIRRTLPEADVVIGAVLVPNSKAPHLVTRDMLKTMKKGAVIVDVCIDQGGCFETSRPTTHDEPVFIVDDVVHYCVTNIPGVVPMTSTPGLTNVTLPYVVELANLGWRQACLKNEDVGRGVSIASGVICNQAVAEAFGMPWKSARQVAEE